MMNNEFKKSILLSCVVAVLILSSFAFKSSSKDTVAYDGMNQTSMQQTASINYSQNKDRAGKKLKIYVTGEVKQPGIYEMEQKSRALDAIKAAGGFTEYADLDKVNVTKMLRDGVQIKVPAVKKFSKKSEISVLQFGEGKIKDRSFKRPNAPLGDSDNLASRKAMITKVVLPRDIRISLNRASLRELCRLPGIHPELARRIIAYREKQKFKNVEEIMQVNGISAEKYAAMSGHLVL